MLKSSKNTNERGGQNIGMESDKIAIYPTFQMKLKKLNFKKEISYKVAMH